MINTKQTLPVSGMTCASCATSVESILNAQEGVKNASVNFASAKVVLEYDPAHTSPDILRQQLSVFGYDLESADTSHELRQEERRTHLHSMKRDAVAALLFALPVVIAGMFFAHSYPWLNWLAMPLTAVVVFGYGRGFFVRAFKQMRSLHSSMDTLIALSTGIAFGWSAVAFLAHDWLMSYGIHPYVYFESAAVIVAFILLGKYLEERAKQQSASAISSLIELQPTTVRIMKNNTEQDVSIERVVYGDSIILRPGERLPVDGIVRSGRSFVDESMLTGESTPIEKVQGNTVYAGTLNQHGSLLIEARGVGKNTLLASIIRTVEEAQGSKAPVQYIVDKIAAVFVPAVLGIAALTFLAWIFLAPEHALTHALSSTIAVLIIACPCALGLATPTALMVGIGNGARHGVLIRNAEALESAHNISAIVFDKTGTLTVGKPTVVSSQWYASLAEESTGESTREQERLYAILYAIESRSEHPLAAALYDYLSKYRQQNIELMDIQAVAGKGIRATIDGVHYFAGSKAFIEEQNITVPSVAAFKGSVVYFSTQNTLLCSFIISDALKEGASAAITELKRLHITPHLLTGDNAAIAGAIATQAGIECVVANMQPQQKQEYVEMLKARGEVVAMVGDGINDAQALAVANVGIAMGKGTEVAMNTSHITLMNSDVRSILHAIRLSRATVRIIKQNLFWAFGYNVILIPLAAGILYPINGFQLDPMIAGAAMALSSVSVVSNSLRLRKV